MIQNAPKEAQFYSLLQSIHLFDKKINQIARIKIFILSNHLFSVSKIWGRAFVQTTIVT